jgi:hypothetical protein
LPEQEGDQKSFVFQLSERIQGWVRIKIRGMQQLFQPSLQYLPLISGRLFRSGKSWSESSER